MGFYSSTRLYQESFSEVPEVTLEQVVQDPNVLPTEQEDLIEASLNIIDNIQENQNRFFQHIGIAELDYLEEHGEELVYTEGVLSDIVSTIKSFLMKIWERIKSLFKRFIMILDSYTKNDKDFAKKYQKEIFSKSGDTSDFSFKGYKWKIDTNQVNKLIESCDAEARHILHNYIKKEGYMHVSTDKTQKGLENLSDEIEELRGKCLKDQQIGNGGRMTEEEFRKELHEYFRGGETEKEELDSKDLDVHDMYNKLITSNQDRKDVDKVFKENKKSIDQTEKELIRLQNEYAKEAHEKYSNDKDKTIPDASTITVKAGIKKEEWKRMNAKEKMELLKRSHPDAKDYHGLMIYLDNYFDDDTGYESEDIPLEYNMNYTTARDKGNRYSKALSIAMRIVGASKSAVIAIDSEFLNAMKERSRQYKACLIAYVHYRPSSESAMHEQHIYNELDYARFSSPLKGINLF